MSRRRRRWLRLTDEEIARVRLLLSRESDRLAQESFDDDDPNESVTNWSAIFQIGYIIERIDSIYRNRNRS